MFTKKVGAAAIGIAIAVTGAACGGSDDEGAVSSAAAGSTAQAKASGGLKGSITTWIMGSASDPGAQVVKGQASQFEQAHPGTKVDVQFIDWSQAHDKFTTSIAGGQVPDVAEVGTTWTPEFASLGAFEEQSAPPEGQYVSSLKDAGTVDGKFYGRPWYAGARALFYRTDVFKKLNLQPPKTWEDWQAAMKTIKEKGGGIYPFATTTVQDGMHSFLPLVWQAGGQIATQDGDQWKSGMDSAEAVKALDFYANIYKQGYSPKASITWSGLDAEKAFITGKVAMFIGVGWNIADIQKQAPKLQWTTTQVPAGPSGKATVFAGGSHLAVFKGSKNKDLANAFVSFMLDPKNDTDFAQKVGLVPGTTDAIKSGPFMTQPLAGVMAKEILEDSNTYPPSPKWGAFEGSKIFETAMQDIMSGRASAQDAGKKLAEQMNKEFEG